MRLFQGGDGGVKVELITPASADVIRGGFFASAKKMTLITVSWMRLLDEAAARRIKATSSILI